MFAEGGPHTSSQEHTHPHHPLPPPPPHHRPHRHLSCLAPQPFYSQWAAVGWWQHLERFCLNCDGDRVWPLAGGDVAAAGNHPPTCHLPVTSHFFTRPHFALLLQAQLGQHGNFCVLPYLQEQTICWRVPTSQDVLV